MLVREQREGMGELVVLAKQLKISWRDQVLDVVERNRMGPPRRERGPRGMERYSLDEYQMLCCIRQSQ